MTLEIDASNSSARTFALLFLTFIISAAVSAFVEILLCQLESLFAFILPFLIYILGALRFVPWKTPMRKASSLGILLGMFSPLILYSFGVSGLWGR